MIVSKRYDAKYHILRFVVNNFSLSESISKSWEIGNSSSTTFKRILHAWTRNIDTIFGWIWQTKPKKRGFIHLKTRPVNKLTKNYVETLKQEIKNCFLTTKFFITGVNNLYTLFPPILFIWEVNNLTHFPTIESFIRGVNNLSVTLLPDFFIQGVNNLNAFPYNRILY